jgi:hypothetical protein
MEKIGEMQKWKVKKSKKGSTFICPPFLAHLYLDS